MINWASSDVDKLLLVASKQEDRLLQRGGHGRMCVKAAISMSNKHISQLRDMKCARGIVCKIPVGQFIGRGGENIKRVAMQIGGGKIQERPGLGWEIYYEHQDQLDYVKREMGY